MNKEVFEAAPHRIFWKDSIFGQFLVVASKVFGRVIIKLLSFDSFFFLFEGLFEKEHFECHFQL